MKEWAKTILKQVIKEAFGEGFKSTIAVMALGSMMAIGFWLGGVIDTSTLRTVSQSMIPGVATTTGLIWSIIYGKAVFNYRINKVIYRNHLA